MATPIRVGAVSYLNARPLYHRLREFAPEVQLIMDYPSRLAEQLDRNLLDLALIPSIEYLRGASKGYEILLRAARGPAWRRRQLEKLFEVVYWEDEDSESADSTAGKRSDVGPSRAEKEPP